MKPTKKRKTLSLLLSIIVIFFVSTILYKNFLNTPAKQLYKTAKPEQRTIDKIIDASGSIKIESRIKIGSHVSGIIKKLYIDENHEVKKGQILAEIDTGKGETELKETKALLQKAFADYIYQKKYYQREKELYKSNQLSKNEFESFTKVYLQSKASYEYAKAHFQKIKLEYNNAKIHATANGIVTHVDVAEGERIATDLKATTLFEIAKDITKMEASLEIDECDIGYVTIGQNVEFTVDSFPYKTFKTKIFEIGYSAKSKNNNLHYKATVKVDNSEKLLRPGMTLNARIFIAKAENVLAITSQAFMISPEILKEIAKDINYEFEPLDEKDKQIKDVSGEMQAKTIWAVKDKSFVEKLVIINLTDDIYFEVISGLNKNDNVIIDIEESDELEEKLKKAFSNF